MALATWWRGDPLPQLPMEPGLNVAPMTDMEALSELNRLPQDEAQRRINEGHVPYVGTVQGEPVSYGWVARTWADIGELGTRFQLESGDRYLWDFGTLPPFRGRGIYPQVLQAILGLEDAERFWIVYAPENRASKLGVRKAGFVRVGHLSFGLDGRPVLVPYRNGSRARAGAHLLGVARTQDRVWPCWECFQQGRCSCGELGCGEQPNVRSIQTTRAPRLTAGARP